MTEFGESTQPGVLVRTTEVFNNGRSAVLADRNGLMRLLSSGENLDLEVGDVLIVANNSFERVPHTLWDEGSSEIGIVHSTYETDVLVSTGLGFVLIPKTGKAAAPGNTVLYSKESGVARILDTKPISFRDDPVGLGSDHREPKLEEESFDELGGMAEAKRAMRELVELPLTHSEQLKSIGAEPVSGVLLIGPPGTGKTHLARIAASNANANFYSINGPEVVTKWVGESEQTIRRLFEQAQKNGPSIVLMDELDSIAPRRSANSHEHDRRLVAQLLVMLDGLGSRSDVVTIATTNRREDIDPALLRPGRFDRLIEVQLPSKIDRKQILEVQSKRMAVGREVQLSDWASQTEGWSGAELKALLNEAAIAAVVDDRSEIAADDLAIALDRVREGRTG